MNVVRTIVMAAVRRNCLMVRARSGRARFVVDDVECFLGICFLYRKVFIMFSKVVLAW